MAKNELRINIETQLTKALEYLEYSYNKILTISDSQSTLDQETLETWESFAARFSRVADIYLSKYLRCRILEDDPGFRGSFRDYMNRAEKLKLLDNVETWMTIRALRNLAVHEYAEENLAEYFANLKSLTPKLLGIKNLLSP